MTSPGSARSARAAAFSVDDGLLRDSEHPSIKRRSVSANILLARDFASCSVAEKIDRFLQENLQETASFPIGPTVPVMHSTTVKMRVTCSRRKPPRRRSLTFPPRSPLLIHAFCSVWILQTHTVRNKAVAYQNEWVSMREDAEF